MYSARSTRALPRVGFPIRRSRDQRLVSTSPALIAAAHVLHRLLAPRHPPCALVLLIEKNTLCVAMEFSRCSGPKRPRENRPAKDGLSKLSSDCLLRGRRNSRRPGCSDEGNEHRARLKSGTENKSIINEPGATGVIAPESLERR
jgi:hypothetical protein